MARQHRQTVGKKLTIYDVGNLYAEKVEGPANILCVRVVDMASDPAGPMDEDGFLRWVDERTSSIESFHRRVQRYPFDVDYPYWAHDEQFDLRNHAFYHRAEGMSWGEAKRAIMEIAAAPIPHSKPLWEIHMFAGLEQTATIPAGAAMVVVKANHSLFDGASGIVVVQKLFGGDASESLTWTEPNDPIPSTGDAVRQAPRRVIEAVVGQWKVRRIERNLLKEFARAKSGPARDLAPSRFSGPIGALAVDVVEFSVAELRAIADATPGCTVNDTLVTIISGAMSAYLAEVGESPEGSLCAVVPISLRRPDDRFGGNLFYGARIDLYSDLGDPAERLRLIHEGIAGAKKSVRRPEVVAQRVLGESGVAWGPKVLGWMERRGSRGRRAVESLDSSLITNVMLSPGGQCVRGAPVVTGMVIPKLTDRMRLGHAVDTMGDTTFLTILADVDAMPNLEHYADLLRRSASELTQAATKA